MLPINKTLFVNSRVNAIKLTYFRFVTTRSEFNHCVNNANRIYYKKLLSKETLELTKDRPAHWDKALPYEAIPGPKSLPIVGNTLRFMFGEYANLDNYDISAKVYRDYGKIAVIRGLPGRNDMVMLCDPVDIEKLFRNDSIFPLRDIFKSLAACRLQIRKDLHHDSPSILTVHGEEWFNMRTKINPILMQPKTIDQYTNPMNKIATDMVNVIKKLSSKGYNNKMPKNFEYFIQNWALESIGCFAFNLRFGCLSEEPTQETKDIINTVDRIFYAHYELDFKPTGPLLKKINSKIWKTFVKDMDFMIETVKKYIAISKEHMEDNKASKIYKGQSILEKLLAVDEKVAITFIIDMIIGGIDTTTKTTGTVLYHLARNKDAQQKLQKELRSLLPTPDSPITKEVINNANYLKAALKESMRLTPIAIGTLRTTTKEMVLGGYRIPKGVDVVSSNSIISVIEEHFKRPNEFIPERWLRCTKNELSHRNTSPFVSLPFGFGQRSCVGQRLASLEIHVLLAKIIRNFTLDWPNEDMKFVTALIRGCADPLKIKMVPVAD